MIARVFPRRTSMTPVDEYAFVGDPPLFLPDNITEVHVSVTFSWDLDEGERLVEAWSRITPARIGGPATGQRGEDFVPGMYLRQGVTITSRGCPNSCWFCVVPKRDGKLRELSISPGHIVQDDNLRDTIAAAEKRLTDVLRLGFLPYAMLWRDLHGRIAVKDPVWAKLQKEYLRPAIIKKKLITL